MGIKIDIERLSARMITVSVSALAVVGLLAVLLGATYDVVTPILGIVAVIASFQLLQGILIKSKLVLIRNVTSDVHAKGGKYES